MSLSARRAWIEICSQPYRWYRVSSLSARRAWIEIWPMLNTWSAQTVALRKESVDRNPRFRVNSASAAVALRKESVDRNPALPTSAKTSTVALRKESVDRNSSQAIVYAHSRWSLSARRAWIEIRLRRSGRIRPPVALRKESVDRNHLQNNARRMARVALRKESVDRNSAVAIFIRKNGESLSARRAWIEICSTRVRLAVYNRRSPQGERG